MILLYRLASVCVSLSAMAVVALSVGLSYGLEIDGIATTVWPWLTGVYIVSLILYLSLEDRMPKKHDRM